MKSTFALPAVLSALVFLSSCATTTELIGSQKIGESEPKQYQKLGVVVISPKMEHRSEVEIAVANALRDKGVKAIATFTIFPMVGSLDKIKENMDEATIQQKIRQRVADNQVDGLLIISLFDKTKEQRYVQGSSISISAPVYGYPYYGYYGYAYSTVYSSGYYTTDTKYFLESNLYDVATEKLVWTAQTKTTNPKSVEDGAANFANVITTKMLAEKALVP